MLQLGWKAGTEQYPPNELLDYAVAAEEAGFDSVDASDHFHPWSEDGQACFVWSWLGAVAARTRRIMLGTGVTCPIFRYHPAVVAQAAATLSQMTSTAPGATRTANRFYLGIGTGEALNEFATTAEWPAYNVRRERMIEAIELIRALWTGEKITHHGKHYQTRQAKLYTLPASPIPIYVSALAPASARVAGRYGDALITVGGKEPELYQQIIESFEAGAREAGKDPARMPRMIELAAAFTKDEQQAIEYRKRFWAGTFVPALFLEKIYTPAMSAQNGTAVGADTIKQAACISADPAEHVKMARQYIDLGFDHLIFHSAGPDQRAFIQAYGREVLPRLRDSAGSAAVRSG
jgi:coenzyme F420-dependent glucose-6-phosphate dehydrogenase